LQNGTDALASMFNCNHPEGLTFRAELSTSGAERFELTKRKLGVATPSHRIHRDPQPRLELRDGGDDLLPDCL